MNLQEDRFPASEFDDWAGEYDRDVTSGDFPFTGYDRVLAEVVRLAGASRDMSVLDLGTGTGNLAQMFGQLGCEVWGTDFSEEMLKRARAKLPAAQFFLHDLRNPLPAALSRRFDCIVSAYVFHHFELREKVAIAERLVRDHLAPSGRLVIADISFRTEEALAEYRAAAGDVWEEEPYWLAGDALAALRDAGLSADYLQVAPCAGVYRITPKQNAPRSPSSHKNDSTSAANCLPFAGCPMRG